MMEVSDRDQIELDQLNDGDDEAEILAPKIAQNLQSQVSLYHLFI